jgi:hypothetical protein
MGNLVSLKVINIKINNDAVIVRVKRAVNASDYLLMCC